MLYYLQLVELNTEPRTYCHIKFRVCRSIHLFVFISYPMRYKNTSRTLDWGKHNFDFTIGIRRQAGSIPYNARPACIIPYILIIVNYTIFFSICRSEYIGVWKMETKLSTRYFEGMAHGIECIAYDWITGNLYWTDSEFKWVMAADKEFSHYAPVYRTSPDPAYGLAVHSVKR